MRNHISFVSIKSNPILSSSESNFIQMIFYACVKKYEPCFKFEAGANAGGQFPIFCLSVVCHPTSTLAAIRHLQAVIFFQPHQTVIVSLSCYFNRAFIIASVSKFYRSTSPSIVSPSPQPRPSKKKHTFQSTR